MTIVRAITTATITAIFTLGLCALPALADQSGTFTVYGTDDCQQLGANLVTTGNVYVLAGKKTADAPADGAALVSFPGAGQCWQPGHQNVARLPAPKRRLRIVPSQRRQGRSRRP